MSASKRSGPKTGKHLHRISKKGAHAVKRTFVTLGDLVSAAYEVAGSTDAAATLLFSPLSPLHQLLGRRVIFAPA